MLISWYLSAGSQGNEDEVMLEDMDGHFFILHSKARQTYHRPTRQPFVKEIQSFNKPALFGEEFMLKSFKSITLKFHSA